MKAQSDSIIFHVPANQSESKNRKLDSRFPPFLLPFNDLAFSTFFHRWDPCLPKLLAKERRTFDASSTSIKINFLEITRIFQ
jgi:hypothetical protein